MLRFRTVEDEKRYLALMTEVYLRLGTSGISPIVVSEILRNIAKIEAFAFYEGVRQGVVAGVVNERLDVNEPSALDLHRALYGSADTPLTIKEQEHARSADLDDLVKVFSDQPAEFAPLTLQEAIQKYGANLEPSLPQSVGVDRGQIRISEDFDRPMKLVDDDEDILKQLENMANEWDTDQSTESPESLDDIRDELKRLLAGGWMPKDYPEVVLMLHRVLHRDAVFIDLQLGSAVGRNVLAQVGLLNLPFTPMDGSDVDIKFVEAP